jgi:hypothetical protein
MSRTGLNILILAVTACVGLETGCGTPAKQTPPPSLLGTWVGTVTVGAITGGGSGSQVPISMSVFGAESDSNQNIDVVTISVGGCYGSGSTSQTTNGIDWSTATDFEITANQPVGNEFSAQLSGTYDPSTPNTLTGSVGATQQPDGSASFCSMTGNYSMTLQPTQ